MVRHEHLEVRHPVIKLTTAQCGNNPLQPDPHVRAERVHHDQECCVGRPVAASSVQKEEHGSDEQRGGGDVILLQRR